MGLFTSLAAAKYLFSGNGGGSPRHTVRITPEQLHELQRQQAVHDSICHAEFESSNGGHLVQAMSDAVHYIFCDIHGAIFAGVVVLLAAVIGLSFKRFWCWLEGCDETYYVRYVSDTVWLWVSIIAGILLLLRFGVWFYSPYSP